MRSLVLIQSGKPEEISVSDEIWNELEEQDMPGISLGKIRIYRERAEKKLGLATVYKGAGDKVDVIFESLVAAQCLLIEYLKDQQENQEIKGTHYHDIAVAIYYVLAKEFDTKNPVIDFDKSKIFDSVEGRGREIINNMEKKFYGHGKYN